MNWRRTATGVTTLLMLLTMSGLASAQTAGGTGVISGTVTDNTKAYFLASPSRRWAPPRWGTPTAVTGDRTFRIPSLPPGE